MARYFELLGQRVEVHYRASDILLSATGTLAADSGKSIFLEEHFTQRGQVKTFRWEIPYPCIIRLAESPAPPPAPAPAAPREAEAEATESGILPLRHRPKEA